MSAMSLPRWMNVTLKLEWLCLALAMIVAFWAVGGSWLLFGVLVLAPDLSMLGYLAGPHVGARAYNLAHIVVGPALLAGAAWLTAHDVALQVAIVWLLHIAVDRALGYELKLPSSFRDTHLGRVGRS